MSSGCVRRHHQHHDLRPGGLLEGRQLGFQRAALRGVERAGLVDDARRQRRHRQHVLRPAGAAAAHSQAASSSRSVCIDGPGSQRAHHFDAAAAGAAGLSKFTAGGALIAASFCTVKFGLTGS